MIGLDTNILLRLALKDDPAQTELAQALISTHCTPEQPGFINIIVLGEFTSVLAQRLRYSRTHVAGAVEALLYCPYFHLQYRRLVEIALSLYLKNTADFSDILIGLLNHHEGADYTVTFDRAAARLPEFKLLRA